MPFCKNCQQPWQSAAQKDEEEPADDGGGDDMVAIMGLLKHGKLDAASDAVMALRQKTKEAMEAAERAAAQDPNKPFSVFARKQLQGELCDSWT